jgi:hypothetical protein
MLFASLLSLEQLCTGAGSFLKPFESQGKEIEVHGMDTAKLSLTLIGTKSANNN